MTYHDVMRTCSSLFFSLVLLAGTSGAVHAQVYGTHYVYDDYGRVLETTTQDYESRTVNTLK